MWLAVAIITLILVVIAAIGPYFGLYGDLEKTEPDKAQKK